MCELVQQNARQCLMMMTCAWGRLTWVVERAVAVVEVVEVVVVDVVVAVVEVMVEVEGWLG